MPSFYKQKNIYYKFHALSILSITLFIIFYSTLRKHNKKKVGIIGLKNSNNIGNNLVKFSIYTKLKEFGFEPIILGFSCKKRNIDFLKEHVKLKEIKRSYSELKEKDYDILTVNSDQTWNGHKRNTTNLLYYRLEKKGN